MKIIITERQQRLLEMSPSIRRRIGMGEDYIMNLSPSDVCDYFLKKYTKDIIEFFNSNLCKK
jgi:hypothetical protein